MIRSTSSSTDWRFLLWLVAAGIALRLIWQVAVLGVPLTQFLGAGEATRVALSLARTGVFGDAFHAGYGPTAHLSPVSPSIAAGIMLALGVDTPAANVALLTWSLGQAAAGWCLLVLLFRRLQLDATALRLGMAVLCLMPVFIGDEVIVFRFWDGALALMLVLVNLTLVIAMADARDPDLRVLGAISALAAATLFVSPAAGMAIGLCWGAWGLAHLSWRRLAGFAAMGAAALTLMVLPWAIRNQQMIGEPVLLRSNAGLELAIGNHPQALSGRPHGEVFAERLREVQPYFSPRARAQIARMGGEAAYSRALGAEAMAWIADHPAGFVTLCARHVRQFFFPEPWQLEMTWAGPRAAMMGLVSGIGLIGLAIGLWRGRRGYPVIALYLGAVALPYAVVQPTQRYAYLIHGILVMLAADAVVRLVRHLARPATRLATA
ncbi:hypothetical protein ACPVPU_05095 [Sphingomonas sp. CJ99]